ncbi:MAG TPA: CheB methylesterase domain-containing protein [Caulobacteraceae bacterium]|jgi:two-component system chemotaxis response regulator CheB|nr:CheB methylesterase domain-containing protein [Caulobacteraceae bacterium]
MKPRIVPRPDLVRSAKRQPFPWNGRVVGIGASAGGAEALMEIVAQLPPDGPPILIVQHIPALFVKGLAEHLDRASPSRVVVAEAGTPLSVGHAYLAPTDRHLVLGRPAGGPATWCCRFDSAPEVNGFRPSVDVLFTSLAQIGEKAVGVILSGLGRDGAAGLLALRQAGGRTLGQNAASSIVYGMPKAAMEVGAVERQGTPAGLAAQILRLCRTHEGRTSDA